jgi:hypothetical protein
MTLAQIVENPMTVAMDEAISSFADIRQGRSSPLLLRPNRMQSSRSICMRQKHCRRLKWGQRCLNRLTVRCLPDRLRGLLSQEGTAGKDEPGE